MKTFGWALIGPGKIAHRFAEAVHRTDGAALIAVLGRDPVRAGAFARHWSHDGTQVEVAVDMSALLSDERIDAVYIASPHAFHAEAIRQCLAGGKPVLCEKPLVPNHPQGIEVTGLARQHGVFLMEAVWTRYLPVYAVVQDWLRAGTIGRVRAIQSSFCFNTPYDPTNRAFDPAQAGGALLDLGIYNLTMTRWTLATTLGHCPLPESVHASALIGPTGVDHRTSATLEFAGGVASQFVCAFDASADNLFRIIGEHGTITLPRFWEATEASLIVAGKDAEKVQRAFHINGFEYEIEEAMGAIRRGQIESPGNAHVETLATLEWMDRIREAIGVCYPFERAD